MKDDIRERLTALLLPLCEGVADCWRTDPEKHCSVLIDDVLTVMKQDDVRREIGRRLAVSSF